MRARDGAAVRFYKYSGVVVPSAPLLLFHVPPIYLSFPSPVSILVIDCPDYLSKCIIFFTSSSSPHDCHLSFSRFQSLAQFHVTIDFNSLQVDSIQVFSFISNKTTASLFYRLNKQTLYFFGQFRIN